MKRMICFLFVFLLLIGVTPIAWATPTLELSTQSKVNYYIGLTFDASLPVYSHNGLFEVYVKKAEELIAAYGDAFQLGVRQISGDPVKYTWNIMSWGKTRGVYAFLDEMPAAATTAVFEISCSIGPLSKTCTVTANFLSVPLPTGVDGVPDKIDVYVGEPVALNTQILPVGWNLPGYQVQEYFEGAEDTAPDYVYYQDGLNLIPMVTGDYEAAYVAQIDTIIIAKYVVLHVMEKDNWQLVLPVDLKVIEADAFYGIDAESVKIPDGTTAIGDRAFADSSVRQVYIPASVNQFGVELFPAGTIIYTPANSPAESWAKGNKYPIIYVNNSRKILILLSFGRIIPLRQNN